MRVFHPDELPEREVNISGPLFTGAATSQRVLSSDVAQYNVAFINFAEAVRNKFHTHSGDQLLIVTAGHGMVATEAEELELRPGDIAHIPAGEKHRHGALPGSTMTHISVLPAGSETTQVEA
jgi:quercetin dioxygenase-like cupin family protein